MRRFGTSLIAVALILMTAGCGPAATRSAPWYEVSLSEKESVVVLGSGTPYHGTDTAIGKAEYLDVSACELLDKVFDRSLTELQREQLWNAYKGKSVRWIGELEDVESLRSGIRAAFSPGIEVVFDESQMATLSALEKGELCMYSGTLESFGDSYSSYHGVRNTLRLGNGKVIAPEVISLLWEKEVPVFNEMELHMALPSQPAFLVMNDRIFKGPGEMTTWFGDFKVFGINRITGEITWEKTLPPPESPAQGIQHAGKLVAADNGSVYVVVWFQEHFRGQAAYRDTYTVFALDSVTGRLTLQRSLVYEYGGLSFLLSRYKEREDAINDLIRSLAGRELVFCTEQALSREATYGDLVFKWTHRWYGLQACDRVTGCVLWSRHIADPVVYVETSDATLRVLTTQKYYAFKLATGSQVTLTLYAHEGSSSGPVIIGAKVTGQDGAGNPFSQTTNSNGYVTITGVPGTWSFTLSKIGYETNSWSQGITTTEEKEVYLTKQGTQSLAQLIQSLTISSVPVTVSGQTFLILTLEHRIDPTTLKVVAGSGQTTVYVDSDGNPVSDGSIAQKIGIIETAREMEDPQLSQRIVLLGEVSEALSQIGWNRWVNVVSSGVVDHIKWQTEYNFEDFIGFWDPARTTWRNIGTATHKSPPAGLLAKAATALLERILGDPFNEVKNDLQNRLSRAVDHYNSIVGTKKGEIADYGEASTFLNNLYRGRNNEEIAGYLNNKLSKNVYNSLNSAGPIASILTLGLMKVPLVGQAIALAIALLEFPKLALKAKLATDWTVDTLYQDVVKQYETNADLLYRLTDSAEYSLQLGQAHQEVTSYKTKYLNEQATGYAEAQKIPHAVYDYLWDIDTWWDSFVTVVTLGRLRSPGEFRVYDSQGRVTGLVDGETKEEIPDSVYSDGAVLIFGSTDSYRYEVVGTGHGTYGLEIAIKEGEEAKGIAFSDLAIVPYEVHRYTVVGGTPSSGQATATIEIDFDGDGVFQHSKTLCPPDAAFTISPGTISTNKVVSFEASQSSNTDGQIVSYQWNFGDGSTSTGKTATHAYSLPAEYVVSLAVVDNDGVISTYSRFVPVSERQRMPTWGWITVVTGILVLAVVVLRKRRTAKVQH